MHLPLRALAGAALATGLMLPVSSLAGGSQAFTDIGAGLTGVGFCDLEWGDYDADGDLDFVVIGQTQVGTLIARVYRNTAGVFADAGALPASAAVSAGSVSWGDYDRDGDLDLALSGANGPEVTRIYRNDSGTFVDIGAGLLAVRGEVAWGDYDNDGDLDLAVTGWTGSAPSTRLYRNDGGVFTNVVAGFTPMQLSALAWGDYDKDGDLDLALGGLAGSSLTHLYRNTGGSFALVAAGLPGITDGGLAWGDYDNDGDLDMALVGGTTAIYRNDGGTFVDIQAGLESFYGGKIAWGDIDNDGDLDLAVMGGTGSVSLTLIYRNNAGVFTNTSAGLENVEGSLSFGDYDNDGDLDVLIAGRDFFGSAPLARIYANSGVTANNPPSPPTSLQMSASGGLLTFAWNAATDAQTASAGLTYNLRVGSTPGGGEVVPAMAVSATGRRHVAAHGNVGHRTQWTMPGGSVGPGPLYWSVQAIDPTFAGSVFATQQVQVLGVGGATPAEAVALRLIGPNPFRAETRFAYTLTRAAPVELAIHDLAGRRVRSIALGERPPGEHEVRWSGDGAHGARLAPGLYLVRLRAGVAEVETSVLKLD